MRKIALVAVLVVLSGGLARAQDERRDGNWWNRQSSVAKVNYMVGFFDGMELGNSFAQPVLTLAANGRVNQAQLNESNAIDKRYSDKVTKYFGNVTNGQVVDGVDEFYKDFRNRSILIVWAIDITVRQIAGEDVESLINARRQTK